jgi:hypothetical protein
MADQQLHWVVFAFQLMEVNKNQRLTGVIET